MQSQSQCHCHCILSQSTLTAYEEETSNEPFRHGKFERFPLWRSRTKEGQCRSFTSLSTSPHPPNSSSSLALQALDDSDVWGEVPLSAYPSFSFFAFASFGKGIWHTYWFTPGQEQVEVVVQSLGTDNVYPKSGQTVRVHYTCRVSRISVPTL